MIESKYLAQFKRLDEVKKDIGFRLNGGRLLVEILPKKEFKSAGGLILASPDSYKGTAETQRALVGIILMTGEGYVDVDGNEIPTEAKVGSIVVLNEFGIKYYSSFPGIEEFTRNTLAMTSESEVQMSFDNIEQYQKYEEVLNNTK
jgi:co-chaperonin GroES (HSP10)